MIQIETINLPEGARVERAYWTTMGHYAFREHDTQQGAEVYALDHPTRVGAEAYNGVPYGDGTVALRADLRVASGGGTDTELVRYLVFRAPGGARIDESWAGPMAPDTLKRAARRELEAGRRVMAEPILQRLADGDPHLASSLREEFDAPEDGPAGWTGRPGDRRAV